MNSFIQAPLAVLGLGGTELVVILLIFLLLFGGSKLPGLARGLGQSIREFKKAANEDEDHKTPPTVAPEVKKPEPAKTNGSN